MAESRKRLLCPHCDEYVSKSTLYHHRSLYNRRDTGGLLVGLLFASINVVANFSDHIDYIDSWKSEFTVDEQLESSAPSDDLECDLSDNFSGDNDAENGDENSVNCDSLEFDNAEANDSESDVSCYKLVCSRS